MAPFDELTARLARAGAPAGRGAYGAVVSRRTPFVLSTTHSSLALALSLSLSPSPPPSLSLFLSRARRARSLSRPLSHAPPLPPRSALRRARGVRRLFSRRRQLSQNCFFHISDKPAILARCAELLRDGGLLYVEVHSW